MRTQQNNSDLISKGVRALKWSYLGTLTRIVLQLFSQIALARLLGPESFGSFATSVLIIGLGYLITEAGIGAALIRANSISENTIRVAFTWLAIVGTCSSLLVFACAEWISAFFDNQRMALVIKEMAPTLLVQSLGAVSLALLRRDLDYRTIQAIQVFSYLIGFSIVGICAALVGLKEHSLVLAWNTQCLIGSVALYAKTRHAIRPLFKPLERDIYAFGIRTTGANISNWVIENIDNMVVARIYGPAGLGLYSVSYNLVRSPTNHLVTALQQVIFPSAAQAKRERRSVAVGYCTLLSIVGIITLPAFAVAGVLSTEIVDILYGSSWSGAATLLTPLALAMPAHALMAIGGPILSGLGYAKLDFRVQFGTAILFVLVLIVTSSYSLKAVAWGVFTVYLVRAIMISGAVAIAGDVKPNAILAAILPGLVVSVLIGVLAFGINWELSRVNIAPISRFIACGSLSIVATFAVAYLFRNLLFSEDVIRGFQLLTRNSAKPLENTHSIDT